jgi:CheY-like chemotaxis protein
MSFQSSARTPPVERRSDAPRAPTSPQAFRLDGISVLVVEDNERHLELVKSVLEDAGASVNATNSATEALELLQHEPPDVLIADIVMPGHDGFWLMREVRALPADRGGRTPAAAITGLTSSEDRDRLRRAGFEYLVSKPIASIHLAAVVSLLATKK